MKSETWTYSPAPHEPPPFPVVPWGDRPAHDGREDVTRDQDGRFQYPKHAGYCMIFFSGDLETGFHITKETMWTSDLAKPIRSFTDFRQLERVRSARQTPERPRHDGGLALPVNPTPNP